MAIFSKMAGQNYVLKDGDVAVRHAPAYGNPATSEVQSTMAAGLVLLGVFDVRGGDVEGDGTLTVPVDFCRERSGKWYPQDATNPVEELFTIAYGTLAGDASDVATAQSSIGRVLAMDPDKGVFCAFPD